MKNDEFLVITLKHVSGLRVVVNPPRTPKLWAMAHENSHKTCRRRVLGHGLKNISCLMVIVNLLGTPKLWAIAH